MSWKEDLGWVIALECDVTKHLFAKLPREDWQATLAYRPSEGQRSTLELLRYLSFCGIGGSLTCVEGNYGSWKRLSARAEEMEADDFPAAMDRQKQEIAAILDGLTEEDLATRTTKNPPGQELTLGRAFLDVPARWLTGYRMQLFLYARALGADVWTPDCWYGISMKRRPQT